MTLQTIKEMLTVTNASVTMTVGTPCAVTVGKSFSVEFANDWLKFNADKAPTTVATYGKAIGKFLSWLKDNEISRPCRADVQAFKAELEATRKASTARLYVVAVKNFSRWLSQNELYPNFADGVALPKLDEASETHSREALTLAEAKAVLKSFDKPAAANDEKRLRDRVIMRLMINCGLRSVEIIRLDATDIERRHGKLFLKVQGKGRRSKTARVEISKKIYDMILDYLNCRNSKRQAGEPLFVSTSRRNRGQRLQTQTISRLAKATFKTVGIDTETVTCHSCRHTCATLLLNNGTDIRRVQKILRHKSQSTTEIYSHDLTEANDNSINTLSNLLDS